MIHVQDKKFDVFLTQAQIQERISTLARTINADYNDTKITFVVVLSGAFMFASDLLKQIQVNCEVFFIKIKSYEGMASTGKTTEVIGLTTDISGKDIIIIEDIVDTGVTIDNVIELLSEKQCKSIKVASLLFKPDAFKGKNKPNYVGFDIENKFVVGYGLDYDEHGRNLDAIYQLNE
ncbi:MAG TPA: hypoxanthine phosphoribosyltransferase [Crocinitomicaceae bacterium]|nr:hypoxanthine phosphoribosyltransferase [Crocinitomicaceae bacterium]